MVFRFVDFSDLLFWQQYAAKTGVRVSLSETGKSVMQGFGWLLLLLGIGSFVLNYLEREFILLMWVDNWGPEVGLAIRIGLIVLGLILVAAGFMMGDDKSEASSDQ